jgi:YegS C-terminal NAD kinase beta sandwich-like domain
VTIAKGQPWGEPGRLPADGVVVRSDADARTAVTDARRSNRPLPVLGLVGGDLCRTLGGTGDRVRLTSAVAVTFPVDLGSVLVDGRLHWFVAHLVVRSRFWTRAFVAMNAQWRGAWNLGPRAHPDDGMLDTYDARVGWGDLAKVRRRLVHGTHLPHPGITERRVTAAQVSFERPLGLWLDGQPLGRVTSLSVRVEPDALRVVV